MKVMTLMVTMMVVLMKVMTLMVTMGILKKEMRAKTMMGTTRMRMSIMMRMRMRRRKNEIGR